MASKTFELRAWEKNSRAVIFAVQSEALSRTVTVKLLDSGGQPIDLTLSTARLYVIKPDGTKIYVTGTTIDMQNGIVSFLLDSQAAAAAGTAQCYVVVTQADGGTLIFAGMTLIIAPASIDGSVQSTNEFTALQDALRVVQDIDNRIPKTEKGVANGVATLNASGKLDQMPTAADVGAVGTAEKGAANGVATLDANALIPLTQLGIISGSNANGRYVKLPDGTLICTKVYNYVSSIETAEGVLYYGTRQSMGDWALPFIAAPATQVTVTETSAFADAVKSLTATSAGTINLYRTSPAPNTSVPICVTAIGRWK